MAPKDPFETEVSTIARVGQANPAPMQEYTGGWKALEGIMNQAAFATNKIASAKIDKEIDPRAYELWSKADSLVADDIINMTPERREALNKQAAVNGQLSGNMIRALRRKQVLEEADRLGISRASMMKAENDAWASPDTTALVEYSNEEFKRQRDLQIEMDNKIITLMTDSGLAKKNPDGSLNREATLTYALDLAKKTEAIENATDFYQLAGVDKDAYQYAVANKRNADVETMNARIISAYDDLIIDTQLIPLIQELENVRPETFDRNKVAELNVQIQNRIESLKDKVQSASAPEKVKETFIGMLDGYRAQLNLENIQDYSALNTLKQSVELETLLLKEAAAQGSDIVSQMYRVTSTVGPEVAQYLLPKFFGPEEAAIEIPEYYKSPRNLRKIQSVTTSFITGQSPQGRTPQEQRENYSIVNVTTLEMINQDSVKKFENPTAIKNGLLALADSFETSYANPKSPIHLIAQADARKNWSNPNFGKAVVQYVDKDSREFESLTKTAARMIVTNLNNEVNNYLASPANEGSIKFNGKSFVPVNKVGTPILLSHTTAGLSDIVKKANEALDALVNIDIALGAKEDVRKETAELLDEQIFRAINGVSVMPEAI